MELDDFLGAILSARLQHVDSEIDRRPPPGQGSRIREDCRNLLYGSFHAPDSDEMILVVCHRLPEAQASHLRTLSPINGGGKPSPASTTPRPEFSCRSFRARMGPTLASAV